MPTVSFFDRSSSSDAFVVIRPFPGELALGFGVEADGDLDLLISDTDARRIAEGILSALNGSGD